MRAGHTALVGAAILAAMLLLGATIPVALEETPPVQSVSAIASGVQALKESWWFDHGVAEALVSEVIILFLCAAGGSLLVAGLEAFDLWRERREEQAAWLHTRIAKALHRDGVLRSPRRDADRAPAALGRVAADHRVERARPHRLAALRRPARHGA